MEIKASVPKYLWQYLEKDKNIFKFLIKLTRKLKKTKKPQSSHLVVSILHFKHSLACGYQTSWSYLCEFLVYYK